MGVGPAGPGRTSATERRRLRVLLCIEQLPDQWGGIGPWWRPLVDGLSDVEFVLWNLGGGLSGSAGSARRPLPPNVVRSVDVSLAGDEPVRRPGPRLLGRRRAGRDRDVERVFVPVFHELLDSFTRDRFDPQRFARVLSALRAHFEVWDYGATWRSRAMWEAFRERAVPPGDVLGDGGLIAGAWSFPQPDGDGADGEATVGETAEGLRFLYRALSPVTAELPVTDVAHVGSAGLAAIPGILAAIERRTPLLVSEPTLYLRDQYLALARHGLPYPLKRLLLRFASAVAQTAYHLADRVAPVCEWGARWEHAYGVARQRIRVIPPGVDLDAFRPAPTDRSERPTVVSLSPVAPPEDLETLLEVADRVRRAEPDVLFLHHGPTVDGAYAERIRALARDRLLEDTVKLMGPTDRVAAAMTSADVMISTTRSETFPLAVVESLACGTPVVATAVGGVHEALEGPGLTAPAGNADRLAEAVVAILRLPQDQLAMLSDAARSVAEQKFGVATFVERYAQTYAELSGMAVEAAPAARQPEEAVPVEAAVAVAEREVEVAAPTASVVVPPAASVVVPPAASVVVPPAASVVVPPAASVVVPAPAPAPPSVRPGAPAPAPVIPAAPPMPAPLRPEPVPSREPLRRHAPAASLHGRRPLLWEVPAPTSGTGPAPRIQRPRPPDRPPVEAAHAAARFTAPPIEALPEVRPPAGAQPRFAASPPPPPPPAVPASPAPAVLRPTAPTTNGMGAAELAVALRSQDPFARVGALSTADGGQDVADVVASALADDYPQVRREAVRALRRIGGPMAGRALADAVAQDPSSEVREEAVAALAALLARRIRGQESGA